jgi:prepilin-type N-terminal cleavage/methylation domain-containing protein
VHCEVGQLNTGKNMSKNNSRGFTLLELMITVAVGGIILMLGVAAAAIGMYVLFV